MRRQRLSGSVRQVSARRWMWMVFYDGPTVTDGSGRFVSGYERSEVKATEAAKGRMHAIVTAVAPTFEDIATFKPEITVERLEAAA